MSRQDMRDIKIGLIGGFIALFLIVLPVMSIFAESNAEKAHNKPLVLYFKEI
jgi:hypothetical protein